MLILENRHEVKRVRLVQQVPKVLKVRLAQQVLKVPKVLQVLPENLLLLVMEQVNLKKIIGISMMTLQINGWKVIIRQPLFMQYRMRDYLALLYM